MRAAFFTVQETGQWLGSWTPWYGFVKLPAGVAYRLPAGSHVVAEIHDRGANEQVVERGTLGVYFADNVPSSSPSSISSRSTVSDLVLEAKREGAGNKLRAETRLAADTHAWALRPEISSGVRSIEVSARTANGRTDILLFAKDFSIDWPTPYILETPMLLRKGTMLSVTAYGGPALPGRLRLTVSRY